MKQEGEHFREQATCHRIVPSNIIQNTPWPEITQHPLFISVNWCEGANLATYINAV